jgi:hypothetical protein
MKLSYEKLSIMVALQATLIAISALAIALVINFPDWHHRPPFESVKTFFLILCLVVSILIIFTGGQSILKSGTYFWSKVSCSFVFLLVWWYIAFFLMINTYGS